MTPEIWQTLSPAQQAEHCWRELTEMLRQAIQGEPWRPGNDTTLVVPGMTTIVDLVQPFSQPDA